MRCPLKCSQTSVFCPCDKSSVQMKMSMDHCWNDKPTDKANRSKRYRNYYTGSAMPWRFHISAQLTHERGKVVSPAHRPLLPTRKYSCVDTRVIMRPEGLYQRKISMTPSGIEPATSSLVARCLKERTSGSKNLTRGGPRSNPGFRCEKPATKHLYSVVGTANRYWRTVRGWNPGTVKLFSPKPYRPTFLPTKPRIQWVSAFFCRG